MTKAKHVFAILLITFLFLSLSLPSSARKHGGMIGIDKVLTHEKQQLADNNFSSYQTRKLGVYIKKRGGRLVPRGTRKSSAIRTHVSPVSAIVSLIGYSLFVSLFLF